MNKPKVVIITGGGQGIGFGIADMFITSLAVHRANEMQVDYCLQD